MKFNQDIISVLQSTIKKKGWISLPSEGNSMFPLIQQGEVCRFESFDPATSKKGDIVLFWSTDGKLVAHRVYKMGNTFICKGDTNLRFDEPISLERILGKLVSIKKQNHEIKLNHSMVTFWSKLILTFPFICTILRVYLTRRDKNREAG
jgi:signal peptidase